MGWRRSAQTVFSSINELDDSFISQFLQYKAQSLFWRGAVRLGLLNNLTQLVAYLRGGLAALRDLPHLMESGSLEDRKEFVRAFVGGVSVVPGEARLDVQMRTLPAVGSLLPANSTCGLVAGARYEPIQIEMSPVGRFLAGLRRAA